MTDNYDDSWYQSSYHNDDVVRPIPLTTKIVAPQWCPFLSECLGIRASGRRINNKSNLDFTVKTILNKTNQKNRSFAEMLPCCAPGGYHSLNCKFVKLHFVWKFVFHPCLNISCTPFLIWKWAFFKDKICEIIYFIFICSFTKKKKKSGIYFCAKSPNLVL